MTDPASPSPSRPPIADTLTVQVWAADGTGEAVSLNVKERDLESSGLRIGDVVLLDLNGVAARGRVSQDKGGIWLGTRGVGPRWNRRDVTQQLRAVGITNPMTCEALVIEVEGVALGCTDRDLLARRTAALLSLPETVDGVPGQPLPSRSTYRCDESPRNPAVAAWVLRHALGSCELCGEFAPFRRDDHRPYLEVHHLQPLAENGPDTVDNTVALCPNCHRRMHHAARAERDAARWRLLASCQRLTDAARSLRGAQQGAS